MVPLRGIVGRQTEWSFDRLKRAALLVDSFFIGDLHISTAPPNGAETFAERAATFEFLQEKGLLHRVADLRTDTIFNPRDPEISRMFVNSLDELQASVRLGLCVQEVREALLRRLIPSLVICTAEQSAAGSLR